jgi:CheY-like chemotaxis protein
MHSRVPNLNKTKRVLFVNDSLYNIEMAKFQCMGLIDIEKMADFALSGLSAIAKVCETFEPDCAYTYSLIVMDYDMPLLNGPATALFINNLYNAIKPESG